MRVRERERGIRERDIFKKRIYCIVVKFKKKIFDVGSYEVPGWFLM